MTSEALDTNSTGSRALFGPMRQVGYIVADVETAAMGWVERFGIGPWRIRHGIVFDHCTYQGTSIDVQISMATSYSNGIEVELIAQTSGAASMYSDVVETQGPGVQHVCFYPTDYEAARSHLIATGMSVVLAGAIRGTDFAYLADGQGQMVEIADISADGLAARIERGQAAAAWDGADPLGPARGNAHRWE